MTGFPWPLDGAQEWFENLYNWVSTTAYDSVRGLWDWIVARFHDIVAEIRGGVNWVFDQVWGGIVWLRDQVQGGWEWVWSNVWGGIVWVRDEIIATTQFVWDWTVARFHDIVAEVRGARDWLEEQIKNHLIWVRDQVQGGWEWVWGKVSVGLSDLWTSVSDDIESTYTNIVFWITDVRDQLHGWLSDVGSSILGEFEGVREWADALLHGALSGVAGALGEGLQSLVDWLLKHLTYLSTMIIEAVYPVINAIGGAVRGTVVFLTDAITDGLVAGSPPKEIERASKVLVETSFHRQLKLIDDMYESPASPGDAISTAELVMGIMIGAGTGALALAVAADQIHPLKNVGWRPTVREIIYWAGIPSVTAAIAVLPAGIGLLTPMRYALYERWQPLIPDAPDLIRFAVREVFIPEERARLIVPGPGEDFYTYLAKHGYSRMWGEAFWASHWVRPTVTQLTEYLYRHDDFADQWETEVRLNDLVPYAIPWLKEIIYPPYTRVDVRRMWDMRTISEDEMYTNYRWLGYDDAHAKGMVLWTKVYTAFPDLVARFRNGWITAEEVLGELVEYGMPPERALELLQTKIKVVVEERVESERDLTKADILKLLGIGEISPSQAKAFLMDMGYDDAEATYLIAIQLDRMVEEIKELTSAQILKAYRWKIYERPEAMSKLIEVGWSPNAAEIMLRLEDIRQADADIVRMRERDLSRTDIIKSIHGEIIKRDTGFNYLAYLGYSAWEINIIFTLEGI